MPALRLCSGQSLDWPTPRSPSTRNPPEIPGSFANRFLFRKFQTTAHWSDAWNDLPLRAAVRPPLSGTGHARKKPSQRGFSVYRIPPRQGQSRAGIGDRRGETALFRYFGAVIFSYFSTTVIVGLVLVLLMNTNLLPEIRIAVVPVPRFPTPFAGKE